MDYQERHLCLQCESARLVYAPHLLGHTEKKRIDQSILS